jgi:hypothetical protein
MAINGVTNKASILDTYNNNKEFGGANSAQAPGFNSATKAGELYNGKAQSPITTDFVKGSWPEQGNIKAGVNAATGFTANVKKNALKNSEFTMVKDETTVADFDPLNMNNDYFVTGPSGKTKVTGYNPTKRFNKGALTNPAG